MAGETTVGLYLRSLENDYQQRLREDAMATAARFGWDVRVNAAHNDASRQAAQIADAVAGAKGSGLRAVLVSPVLDDALAEVARTAVRAGVAFALLNREAAFLAALRQDAPGLAVFSVTPDQEEIGRVQARQVRALAPAGGSVLCVAGPSATSSARRRLEGLRAELGDPKWALTVLEADWTSEGARLAVERHLEGAAKGGPTPVVVCAQNDDMALGARQALRDAGSRTGNDALSQLAIIGCDGSPGFGQRLVKEKRLVATIALPSAAGPAVEWIVRAGEGRERPPEQVTLPVSSFPPLETLAARAAG
jgi:ABC-type sugar transport system substrate-binding protein